MILLFLGRPGSGKTSIAKQFVETSDKFFSYVGAGDVARQLAEKDQETAVALSIGLVAPKNKMREAMAKVIAPFRVIDGYPRYTEQLVDFFITCIKDGYKIDDIKFVYVRCDKSIAMRRLVKRGRADDTVGSIAGRMSTFDRETALVVDYLKENYPNMILDINGNDNTIEESVKVVKNFVRSEFVYIEYEDGADTLVRPK